jgi:hypothetical protein
VTFTIGGTAFTLTPLQYIVINGDQQSGYSCYSVFYAPGQPGSHGDNFWVLGDSFLYLYYSIFDIGNNQIGFARSISYNWTQSIDPSLFPEPVTTTTATTRRIMTTTRAATTRIMTTMTTQSTTATMKTTQSTTVIMKTTQNTTATMMATKTGTTTIGKSTTGKPETGAANAYSLPSYFHLVVLIIMIFTHHERIF